MVAESNFFYVFPSPTAIGLRMQLILQYIGDVNYYLCPCLNKLTTGDHWLIPDAFEWRKVLFNRRHFLEIVKMTMPLVMLFLWGLFFFRLLLLPFMLI